MYHFSSTSTSLMGFGMAPPLMPLNWRAFGDEVILEVKSLALDYHLARKSNKTIGAFAFCCTGLMRLCRNKHRKVRLVVRQRMTEASAGVLVAMGERKTKGIERFYSGEATSKCSRSLGSECDT